MAIEKFHRMMNDTIRRITLHSKFIKHRFTKSARSDNKMIVVNASTGRGLKKLKRWQNKKDRQRKK